MKDDAVTRTQVFLFYFILFSKLQLIIDIFKDGRYSVTMNITKENCVRNADVRDWSVDGVIYYKLPVFFEDNAKAMALFTNNCNTMNMRYDDVNVVWTNKRTNGFVFVGRMNARGGMQMQTNKTNNKSDDSQQSNVNNQYAKEIELLEVFFSDVTNESELQSKLEEFNGNLLSIITYLISKRRLNQENNKAKEQNELEQVSCTQTKKN
ncbi:hypothetical protein RFI_01362 [Reticulomyxa filosa]|uniref:Uncharacterized protein n=1 Tax=Reticulomyxa filosa TaxID=46433 RepID=X6PAX7_RETFI|nr:hypothetical protein RFI_01362 [Reticulomyxa filosa]|eukprot:ETO35700.1 hypothetical protein RFI_01362 [Reticulomyxa filosa]